MVEVKGAEEGPGALIRNNFHEGGVPAFI